MKLKIFKTGVFSLIITMALAGCSYNKNDKNLDISKQENYSIDFNSENYTVKSTTVNGESIYYRAFENIVYVSNPVDTEYQSLNFYVPEAYYEGESINGYTIDTAPIFFANSVGGYLPAKATSIENFTEGGFSVGGLSIQESEQGTNFEKPEINEKFPEEKTIEEQENDKSPREQISLENDKENTLAQALSRGYVIAAVGARGRTNTDENGNYTGKAPAVIVDLKAAVRYLHYNDNYMPGDANKIVSNGTSAGGAVSALLGATGDNPDYESYLQELGAAPANDNIFAVSAFCPITNLENADMAYEWQFNGINDYEKMNISRNENGEMNREKVTSSLTETQKMYSDELKTSFINYLNDLKLVDNNGTILALDEDGNGSFKDYVASFIIQSAQAAVNKGEDLSSYSWIKIKDGEVLSVDLDDYFKYMGRSKATTAFDSTDLSSGENSLFGTSTKDTQHFTTFAANNSEESGSLADSKIIKLMNPLNYIGDSKSDTAFYWRIRHGASDSDTSLAIPVILSNILQQNGHSVDFSFEWGMGHKGDYDLENLFDWIDSISK